MAISGLGPHGEKAVLTDSIVLTESEAAVARAGAYAVAVVLHTTTSDWARQELAGMAETLAVSAASIVEVVDCGFDWAKQNRELLKLAGSPVHAVISLPIGNMSAAEGHRAVVRAGKTLVLLDNAPTGFLPGHDYAAVVSADNFGLGAIAADLLSTHLPQEGVAGILTYGADFFATNEREIGFRQWMDLHRSDLTLVRGRFASVEDAGIAYEQLIEQNDDLDGLFVVWDVPALYALEVIRRNSRPLAVTTVDLGNDIIAHLLKGSYLRGIAAQRPYEQGRAAAIVTLLNLIGRPSPTWIATPGLAVRSADVVTAYPSVWRCPVPAALQEMMRTARLPES
jgi:ribose transport system substrate-binding protein